MDKEQAIKKFAVQRPDARAVYGYGSGVFKQSAKGKPLTDVIFLVDDIKEWHLLNMKINPNDYSFVGKMYLNFTSVDKIKGTNGVTYLSEINSGEYTFKYGVMEIVDFINNLDTWGNMFMVGRFHKPVLEIKSEDVVRNIIEYNRKCALMIACLFCDREVSSKDLYNTLCGLSYLGDVRMSIAENPHKVENIVEGCYDKLQDIYPLDENLIEKIGEDKYYIKHEEILCSLQELPSDLLKYLYDRGTDLDDLDMLRINIYDYLINKNKLESRAQIFQGVKTNGITRSIPYTLSKIRKRFSK